MSKIVLVGIVRWDLSRRMAAHAFFLLGLLIQQSRYRTAGITFNRIKAKLMDHLNPLNPGNLYDG